MKKITFTFLLLGLSVTLHAEYGISTDPSAAVTEAQQKVLQINTKLNDAILNLNLTKMDWQKGKLTEALTKAQADSDNDRADQIQKRITEINHREDIEKQKHDIGLQLIQARQQNDQGKVDSLEFQLKELQ